MLERIKFPRIWHLPWSAGLTNDDKKIQDMSVLESNEVVITEKMDGECTTVYSDGYSHARSATYSPHWSRNHIKAMQLEIPEGIRIVGENLMAVHSIKYSNLPSYFMMFGYFEEDLYAGWDNVKILAEQLGLETVPELFRGSYASALEFLETYAVPNEGYVMRITKSFEDFNTGIAKYVRENHVQTDEHWIHTTERNLLK